MGIFNRTKEHGWFEYCLIFMQIIFKSLFMVVLTNIFIVEMVIFEYMSKSISIRISKLINQFIGLAKLYSPFNLEIVNITNSPFHLAIYLVYQEKIKTIGCFSQNYTKKKHVVSRISCSCLNTFLKSRTFFKYY